MDGAAQVWSLAFGGHSPSCAAERLDRLETGCDSASVAYLDLVDTWDDGESLRLYFDAEADCELEGGALGPMGSTLAVIELPPTDGCANIAGCGGAVVARAWAEARCAWYPDAAFVRCGRPGHYQGCLVWGAAKADAILSALLSGPGPLGGAAALAFCYGRHPLDAPPPGRAAGAGAGCSVLLRVGAPWDDVWCRLPGAEFSVAPDGLAEHHRRRMASLRAASAAATKPASPASAAAAAPSFDAAFNKEEGPLALRLAVASLSLWRGGSGASAASGCSSPRGGGGGASLPASSPAASTPTRRAVADADASSSSHAASDCGGGTLSAATSCGLAASSDAAPASPFAALCGKGAAACEDEFWEAAELLILPSRPGL